MKKQCLIVVSGAVMILSLFASGCGKKEILAGTAAVESSQSAEIDLNSLDNLKKATLKVTVGKETREETAANKEDLEKLSQKLFMAEKTDETVEVWTGSLTLEKEGQEEVSVDVFFDEGFLLGTGDGTVYRLPDGSEDMVWGMFTTLKGWVAYGSQVRIEMVEETVKPDTAELVMKLYNETGSPIEYIASPMIYKQAEDGSFEQVESIGGFCGFVSNLDGEEALIKIPWKGMFEATEPGLYKVEIQAMKEEDRWEIWDTFNLEN